MRPGVRTAGLGGYIGLARSAGLDPIRLLTEEASGSPTWPFRTSGCRQRRSRACSNGRPPSRGSRLRPPARRLPPVLHAGTAECRAAGGAGPGRRTRAAVPVRAQLRRSPAGAAGRSRGSGRRCGCGSSSGSRRPPGRRWSWYSRRCSASFASCGRQWEPLSVCFTHRAPASLSHTVWCSGGGCSSGTSSPGSSSAPPSSSPEHEGRPDVAAVREAAPAGARRSRRP